MTTQEEEEIERLLKALDAVRAERDAARRDLKDCCAENHKICDVATADHQRADRAEATLAAIRAFCAGRYIWPQDLLGSARGDGHGTACKKVLALLDAAPDVPRGTPPANNCADG